jgi:hypothetical protein
LKSRLNVLMAAVVATSAACEFGEITIPDGEPIVVVQGVMRPDKARQWILVEETFTGAQPIDSTGSLIPGEAPQLPIRRATVTVTNITYDADPCGTTLFLEGVDAPFLPRGPGLYWSPNACPTMRTGDTLALQVRTGNGDVVRGTTVVPGVNAFLLSAGGDGLRMPGDTLVLNRDRDTLVASARSPSGRTLQIEVRRPTVAAASAPAFWIAVDSTAVAVPGDLPDILTGFQDDTSGIPDRFPPVFTAGAFHSVTVGLGDDAYFDFVRSGNIPPSGRGFINRLDGGMGLFGSMVAATSTLRVVGDLDDAREGTYRLFGTLLGTAVAVELELYVADSGRDSTAVASFVTGAWVLGPILESADGAFAGDSLTLVVEQVPPGTADSVATFVIRGPTEVGASTSVGVFDIDQRRLGSLTLERPPSPSVGG